MYLTIISIALALIVGIGCWLLGAGWLGGLLLGLLALIACWFIGGRILRKRLEPALQQVQRQAEAGMAQAALATLKSILPLGNWIPLLKGQIYAQMGVLAHHHGDRDQARDYLTRAGRRSADAQMLLATLRHKEGEKQQAIDILQLTTRFNRKHVLLHNVLAWMLRKEGRTNDAMAVLNRLLAKQANDVSKDNLLRLQNDQKMIMKSFGLQWFVLGFERPPASMGEMRTGRKGFRQPPKRRR